MLCLPSIRETWKHFDQLYPDFSLELKNVRLGLCANGFSSFHQSETLPYSCRLVVVTPYNFLPELCMMTPYMFLTMFISSLHNPKSKIDVYLQSLINELQQFWNDGVITNDASKRQNLRMRV